MATILTRSRLCRALLTSAIMTLAAASAVRAEEPGVLSEIPTDANAVIVINNVKNLSTKLSNAITRLNLPIPLPPDLAAFALRNIGVTDGFDQNSSAAMVILKPATEGESVLAGPPRVIILLPTSDSKAMLQNLSPTAPDAAGISEVTLPGDAADKGYVANVDKWVALAQDKDALTAYLAHKGSINKTLPAADMKTFSDNDLVIWGNVASTGIGLDKWIEDKQQELTGMMDLANLNKNQDPTAGALQKEAINQYFAAIKEYLKDANTSMFNLRLSDSGVTLGMSTDFKPDSPMAKFVAAQKPSAPLTLQGLPDGDLLAAGSFEYNGPSVGDLVDSIGKQVLANEVIAQDPKIDAYKKALEQYRTMAGISTGGRFVLLQPPAGGKTGLFNGSMIVDCTDPEKYHTLQLDTLKSPLSQQTMNADFKQTVTVEEDAVTVKGLSLTKVHIAFAMRDETPDHPVSPAAKQGLAVIEKMYGPDGMTLYTAVVGKRILTVIGSDATILESSVAAAQADTDILGNNATISAVKDQIVKNPVAVAYFPVAKFVELAQTMIGGTGPAPAGAPVQNAAAVLFSAGVTDNSLTVEYHVPIAAITSTMEAVMHMRQAMQGGPTPPMQP